MASIQRLVSPFTGRLSHRAQVRLVGHPAQSATFRRRRDAERWASALESAIREDRYFPGARARRTCFATVVARYRDTILSSVSPRRRSNCERHLAWWLRCLGPLSLTAITPDRISEGRDALAAQPFRRGKPRITDDDGLMEPHVHRRSGATINRYLATLSHVFTIAIREWRLLDRNPVKDIGRKKESPGRTRFLRDDERDALLGAAAESAWAGLYPLVLLAISTGARRGELLRLRWPDVELQPPSPRAIIPRSKNGDPRRLPLVGKALNALVALERTRDDENGFIFSAGNGVDRPFENFDRYWYTALRKAAIRDFRFHDLRHTCASYLASQGSSLLEIADVLGHRTLTMVKRYSHLAQGHKTALIERMAKARGL